MFDVSPIQILIVVVIALLVFGPRRLPEIGRMLGRGVREFRTVMTVSDPPPPPAARAGGEWTAEEGDDELDGVVVPGETPPRGAGEGAAAASPSRERD